MGNHSFVDRDYLMMQDIARHGGLTAKNLSTLHFYIDEKTKKLDPSKWKPDAQSNCQQRLKLLYDAGWVAWLEVPVVRSEGRKGYIYTLTAKGVHALAKHLGCDEKDVYWRRLNKDSSRLFLEHLMWINKVRVAFTYAVQVSDYEADIALWIDDAQLRRKHSKLRLKDKSILVPDGYAEVTVEKPEPGELAQHFEIDRGTEVGISEVAERKTWERKIEQYLEFYNSTLYKEAYDNAPPGRVLTITTGPKRMARLKHITEKIGGRTRFLFTTMDCIEPVFADYPPEHTTAPQPTYHTILTRPIWEKASLEGKFSYWNLTDTPDLPR